MQSSCLLFSHETHASTKKVDRRGETLDRFYFNLTLGKKNLKQFLFSAFTISFLLACWGKVIEPDLWGKPRERFLTSANAVKQALGLDMQI